MIDISKREVDVPCPNCKRTVRVSLKQVVAEATVTCLSCSTNIKLVDNNKAADKTVRDINKSLADFQKALRSFGK